MKSARAGDTLIEVLFAFAILSLVISVMFSGALSSYKSAVTAQERTQALFLAQYQADALRTYRDSLDWSGITSSSFSYLDGSTVNPTDPLPAIKSYTGVKDSAGNTTTAAQVFCMDLKKISQTSPYNFYWVATTTLAECNVAATIDSIINDNNTEMKLAPNLSSLEIKIETYFSPSASSTDSQRADITVSWQPKNSTIRERVVNTILLTKQR